MAVPLFDLGDDIRGLYQDGIDTIISVLGRDCKLVLDGDRTQCPNCTFDPLKNASSGVYNGTGPKAFTRPPCPVCRGTGVDPSTLERAEVRKFLIKRNLKPSQVFPPGTLTRPVTLARVKGFATDLPVVLQAKHVILDYANALYVNEKYAKLSEPGLTGSIVAGRYFVCYLQRSE